MIYQHWKGGLYRVLPSASRLNFPSISKAHLDKTLEQAELEVPSTAKAWDAERLLDLACFIFLTKLLLSSHCGQGKGCRSENEDEGS